MVKLLLGAIRWVVLVGALVVVLLGVGKLVQDREVLPGAITPTPGPNATVPANDEGRDAKVAPSGYAQSCASGIPWGQQVTRPFICIQSPKAGDSVPAGFTLRGYAGGAFEHTLVATVVAEMANGTRVPPQGAIRVPVTYTAPDIGMPGVWQLNVNLGGLPDGEGKLHIEVFAESPKDGARIAEATLDARLQR